MANPVDNAINLFVHLYQILLICFAGVATCINAERIHPTNRIEFITGE